VIGFLYRNLNLQTFYYHFVIFQVVDARAGPGTKSLTKFKSKNKKKLKLKPESMQKVEKLIKKKHIYMKNDRSGREESPGAGSDEITGKTFNFRVKYKIVKILVALFFQFTVFPL
jgi:hypothetical protein